MPSAVVSGPLKFLATNHFCFVLFSVCMYVCQFYSCIYLAVPTQIFYHDLIVVARDRGRTYCKLTLHIVFSHFNNDGSLSQDHFGIMS